MKEASPQELTSYQIDSAVLLAKEEYITIEIYIVSLDFLLPNL